MSFAHHWKGLSTRRVHWSCAIPEEESLLLVPLRPKDIFNIYHMPTVRQAPMGVGGSLPAWGLWSNLQKERKQGNHGIHKSSAQEPEHK